MKISVSRKRSVARRALTLVAAAAALALAGCNTYYIPPPPTSIVLSSPTPSLVITTTDTTTGATVPAQVQLAGRVSNNTNTNIEYSVGQSGIYVPGGDNVVGTISSGGVYTAPAVVPNPNVITIQAAAQGDPTQKATATITLLNPPADITSVSPNVVTAGQSYTLDLTGTNFAQGATVDLSGAQLGSPQLVSATEIKIQAQIASPGLLTLRVNNPVASTNANVAIIRSQPSSPAGSSALAVVIGRVGTDSSGAVVSGTKVYVPKGGTLAVVNADSGTQIRSVTLPSGYNAGMAAADPAHGQVVVASLASNILQIVNTSTDQVTRSLVAPVSTTANVDGGSCEICSLVVDSARNLAILDTGDGYVAMNLADGSAVGPLAAPAAANFAYDPLTERAYAPYTGSAGPGVNVIDFVAHSVTAAQLDGGNIYGSGPDAAAYNATTGLLTVGDRATGTYLNLNFNNAVHSGGAVQVPASPFTISNGCSGSWNEVNLEISSHLGWYANQGACVGLADMPAGPATGAPGGPSSIRWARVPTAPDGLGWTNTPSGQPATLSTYVGPDGHIYGLALRSDGAVLLKMDLTLLQNAAAVSGGADVNQVDPTQVTVNGATVSAASFITLR